MNTPHTCPKCGALLPADAPEGLCPACLMLGALPTAAATVKLAAAGKSGSTPQMATPTPGELAPYFPNLEIIELLGRGGMGMVYKARQKNLNRLVALKVLPVEAEADEHFAERFQREAQALARLNHPNIVSVFDFGEAKSDAAPSLFYFLMEFVDGANLRTLIRGGDMKPEAALALIPSFCDALQYAHDEGVVHRDIKPENVLVDKRGRVKIADFGLAKLLGHDSPGDTLTRTGMYLGTPRYMAPEQIEKPETVDHRADIYSLGVVFYEMLTGELPMGRFDPPSKKVQVDVKLDEIVLHALERDVARRYQHASEIKTDVQTVAAKAQSVMPPASASSASEDRVGGGESKSGDALGTAISAPRLSRRALWGAICAPFSLCTLALTVIPIALQVGKSSRSSPRSGEVADWIGQHLVGVLVSAGFLILIGVGAILVTTILGGIAVSQIKRSDGKLRGLGLAATDLLCFPLLLLGILTYFLSLIILFGGFGLIVGFKNVDNAYFAIPAGLFSVLLALVACFFAGRAAWRKIAGRSANLEPSTPAAAKSVMEPARPARRPAHWPGLRSWTWPVVAALLVLAAIYVPAPPAMPEPKELNDIFHPIPLVTPSNGSYRFIKLEEQEKVAPVYGVNRTTEAHNTVTRTFGWNSSTGLSFGFFHRSATWKFSLSASRLIGLKGAPDAPFELPAAELAKLRPLLVSHLDLRSMRTGSKSMSSPSYGWLLEDLLDNGRGKATFVCWQNLLVLLAWLSVPMAAVSLILLAWTTTPGKIAVGLAGTAAVVSLAIWTYRTDVATTVSRVARSQMQGQKTASAARAAPAQVPKPPAKPELTAAEILRKMEEKYATLSNFSATGKTVIQSAPASGIVAFSTETTFSINLARPDFYRIEWNQKLNSAFTSFNMNGAVWSAGDGPTLLIPGGKTSKPLNREQALALATGISGGAAHRVPALFFEEKTLNWVRSLKNPSLVRDEKIGDDDCWVISAEHSGEETLWIRKKDHLLKQSKRISGGPESAKAVAKAVTEKASDVSDASLEKMLRLTGQEATPEAIDRMRKSQQFVEKASGSFQSTVTQTFQEISVNQLMEKADFEHAMPADSRATSQDVAPSQSSLGPVK